MKREKKTRVINPKGISYMNYAKWLCMIMVILFMALIFYLMTCQHLSYAELILENPILLAGFIDCLGNVIVYLFIKKDTLKLKENEDVLYIQAKSILYVTIEACLLNMPCMIMLIISSMKCYSWDKQTMYKIKEIVKNKSCNFIGLSLSFFLIVILFYWILTSFSK